MKKTIVIIWLGCLFMAMAGLFWLNDWRYRLPTPIPSHYQPVLPGSLIRLQLPVTDPQKAVFLHFFNPGCPCSRFNIANFKRLYLAYRGQLNFVIVVISDQTYSVKTIQDKFGFPIPVLFNPAIAKACGVYSTPQVALLDTGGHLYYRGNYNRSRYCTDEKTNYAKIAIDGLLKNTRLVFSPMALRAYGCQLPRCIK